MSERYYAVNRWNKTVCVVPAVSWEQLMTMFRVGIQMPDGDLATGVGLCADDGFEARSVKAGYRVLVAAPVGWTEVKS